MFNLFKNQSFLLFFALTIICHGQKDLKDYNEADIEKLFEQWEDKDEQLHPDELPEWKQQSPKVDFSKFQLKNPEDVLKFAKKGKTLITFVTVYGKSKKETEEVTALWQASLQNSHVIADRFMVDDNRTIFMYKDGSQAWEGKDFLINQKYCYEVMMENKIYKGKFRPDVSDCLNYANNCLKQF